MLGKAKKRLVRIKIGELNFDMERILEDLKQTVNDGLSCLGRPAFGFLSESEGKTYSRRSLFNGVIRWDCLSMMHGNSV